MPVVNKGLFTDTPRLPGRVAQHDPRNHAVTFAANTDIKFGHAVMKGTTDPEADLYSGVAGDFVGVARWSKDAKLDDATLNQQQIGYKDSDEMAVHQVGVIAVQAEENVAYGDPVRIRHSVGATIGQFRTTAVAAETTLLAGAKFVSTRKDGVALVELNGFPSFATTDDV